MVIRYILDDRYHIFLSNWEANLVSLLYHRYTRFYCDEYTERSSFEKEKSSSSSFELIQGNQPQDTLDYAQIPGIDSRSFSFFHSSLPSLPLLLLQLFFLLPSDSDNWFILIIFICYLPIYVIGSFARGRVQGILFPSVEEWNVWVGSRDSIIFNLCNIPGKFPPSLPRLLSSLDWVLISPSPSSFPSSISLGSTRKIWTRCSIGR